MSEMQSLKLIGIDLQATTVLVWRRPWISSILTKRGNLTHEVCWTTWPVWTEVFKHDDCGLGHLTTCEAGVLGSFHTEQPEGNRGLHQTRESRSTDRDTPHHVETEQAARRILPNYGVDFRLDGGSICPRASSSADAK